MTQQLSDRRLDTLAAEYVLGTLDAETRLKLQRLMMTSDRVRQAIWQWERDLNALGASLNDVPPSPQLWQRIEARLGLEDLPAGDLGSSDTDQFAARRLQQAATIRPWFWPAIAAMLALVVVSWSALRVMPQAPVQVAVIQDGAAQALWSVSLTDNNLVATSTRQVTSNPERDFELWLVAADGRAPVSLGLLPEAGQRQLTGGALLESIDSEVLAVSREPEGGSPTGQPTEVLYTAQLVNL
ncbi:MAG TPA: anti-sigma factor [Saccharospirillum sp.]|nr:anti-sigma factor [Saccharospirillum sp.]